MAEAARRLGLPSPPVADTGPADPSLLFRGRRDPAAGAVAHAAFRAALEAVRGGRARALVTAPVDKAAWAEAAGGFAGHTELLARAFAPLPAGAPVMLMAERVAPPGARRPLRVAVVTHHIRLAEVPRALSADAIAAKTRRLAEGLRDRFGIPRPRIGILGLNPHAGEGGALGDEEDRLVRPALAALAAEAADFEGPLPPDGAFLPGVRDRFDAILALYHDQGLAPFKAVAGARGVHVTLGLPVVRTSPDHGVAYDLAGTGRADPASMREALRLADELSRS